MRTLVAVLALGFIAVTAVPTSLSNAQQRIVGGSVTTIDRYPHIVAMLVTRNWSTWRQGCGGSIINNRFVLTAAHCVHRTSIGQWRIRVGSTWAESGGVVHNLNAHILHNQYNPSTLDHDIATVRTVNNIGFNNNVQVGRFAGANYHIADNQPVWVAGWGLTSSGGSPSAQLRHVEVRTINRGVCNNLYAQARPARRVTDNMFCAGILNVGGRDACQQDSGGPLYHNRIIAGIVSWGIGCADRRFPGVYVQVQRYTNWIRNNS